MLISKNNCLELEIDNNFKTIQEDQVEFVHGIIIL